MKIKRFAAQICSLLLTFLLLCSTAFAAGTIDTGKKCSLSVDYHGFADVEFSLYRVADISNAEKFTLTGDFLRYPVSVNGLDSAGWEALATTLTSYVRMDSLQPLKTDKTNTGGRLTFQNLQTGLYLVIGESHEEADGWTYTPKPFLVALPGRSIGGSGWNYDVTATPKYSRVQTPPAGSTIDLKALKGWDDAGHEAERPASITLYLLQDGTIYETVTVTKADNWTYTWTDLDAAYSWTVTESPMPDYTVSIRQEGDTFVIINTYDDTSTPPGPGPGPGDPDTPDDPDDPDAPDDPNDPVIPGDPDVPTDPDNPGSSGGGEGDLGEDQPEVPKLPQTGVLWWPVPLMAGLGLVLFILGYMEYRNAEEE